MNYTSKLQLKKPGLEDYVNVEDLNDNADVIDQAISQHTEDTVRHITAEERTKWNNKQDALPTEQKRKITFGTAAPSGGSDGDLYFQYE